MYGMMKILWGILYDQQIIILIFSQSAVVPESRTEEVQTMRAAYAARSIWMQREVKKGQLTVYATFIAPCV